MSVPLLQPCDPAQAGGPHALVDASGHGMERPALDPAYRLISNRMSRSIPMGRKTAVIGCGGVVIVGGSIYALHRWHQHRQEAAIPETLFVLELATA